MARIFIVVISFVFTLGASCAALAQQTWNVCPPQPYCPPPVTAVECPPPATVDKSSSNLDPRYEFVKETLGGKFCYDKKMKEIVYVPSFPKGVATAIYADNLHAPDISGVGKIQIFKSNEVPTHYELHSNKMRYARFVGHLLYVDAQTREGVFTCERKMELMGNRFLVYVYKENDPLDFVLSGVYPLYDKGSFKGQMPTITAHGPYRIKERYHISHPGTEYVENWRAYLNVTGVPCEYICKEAMLINRLKAINEKIAKDGPSPDHSYYFIRSSSIQYNELLLRWSEKIMREHGKLSHAEKYGIESQIIRLFLREIPTKEGFLEFSIFNEWRLISDCWARDAVFSTADVLSQDESLRPILDHRFQNRETNPGARRSELYSLVTSNDPWLWVQFRFLDGTGYITDEEPDSETPRLKIEGDPKLDRHLLDFIEASTGGHFIPEQFPSRTLW